MTNLYFNTVKMLLERISSVMIDSIALEHLISYVEDCLKGGNSIEEIGLNPSTAGERGVRLIQVRTSLAKCQFFRMSNYRFQQSAIFFFRYCRLCILLII